MSRWLRTVGAHPMPNKCTHLWVTPPYRKTWWPSSGPAYAPSSACSKPTRGCPLHGPPAGPRREEDVPGGGYEAAGGVLYLMEGAIHPGPKVRPAIHPSLAKNWAPFLGRIKVQMCMSPSAGPAAEHPSADPHLEIPHAGACQPSIEWSEPTIPHVSGHTFHCLRFPYHSFRRMVGSC